MTTPFIYMRGPRPIERSVHPSTKNQSTLFFVFYLKLFQLAAAWRSAVATGHAGEGPPPLLLHSGRRCLEELPPLLRPDPAHRCLEGSSPPLPARIWLAAARRGSRHRCSARIRLAAAQRGAAAATCMGEGDTAAANPCSRRPPPCQREGSMLEREEGEGRGTRWEG